MLDSSIPEKVVIWEVLPRDGFQTVKEWIPTKEKIQMIKELVDVGIKNIEATSFVHPKAIPQLRDAEEVIKGIQELVNVNIRALVPNLIGAERAIQAGVTKLKLLLSSTDSHSLSNSNCTIDKAKENLLPVIELSNKHNIEIGGSLTVTFGCPYEGVVPIERIVSLVDWYSKQGVNEISLADTSGMGNPIQVSKILKELNENFPDLTFSLHLHNTRGMAFANAMAGLINGVTIFDSSASGLGGCPYSPNATGNIATEDIVHGFHEMNIDTGINLDQLMIISKKIANRFNHFNGSFLIKAGQNKDLYRKPKGQIKIDQINS